MVKFSKQLELQLVPEWKSAFCNYWKLKKDLKLIRLQENEWQQISPAAADAYMFMANLSSITRRRPSSLRCPQDVIKVHHQRCSSHGQIEIYETEVLEPLCGNECEVAFFKGVDEELNKVNDFYASKEDEYAHRMEALKRQLTNLIGMCKALEEQQASSSSSPSSSSTRLCFMPQKSPSSTPEKSLLGGGGNYGVVESDANSQMAGMCEMTPKVEHEMAVSAAASSSSSSSTDYYGGTGGHGKAAAGQQVLRPKVAPMSALTHLLLWADVVNNGRLHIHDASAIPKKKTLQYARKTLRTAFVEYYRGLGLLKSFSSLNMLAFGKILKKYDKVTGRNASTPYLKALERSRLNSSNKVDHLLEEVERLFAQYFAKDDKKKAMMLLRPAQQKVCHSTTYFIGFFSGWSISFLVAFIILFNFHGAHFSNSKLQSYAKKIYPMYSMLLLILLHMFMYGWNVGIWRQVRINYPFIFEFAPRTELRSREILLVCACLTTLVVASMVCHLIFYLHGATLLNPNSIPFATILVSLIILLCPLNIFHRSSRFFLLKCMKRIILAPFYKVAMADFFLADQLTSQVTAIRQTQSIVCYYFGGQALTHTSHMCGEPKDHQFAYVLSFLPYWWRLMQCLRRWNDEGDRVHLANGGKYLSAMIAVACRLTFQFYPSKAWLAIFITTSSLATVYQMYWDVVMDWGLLQPHSKNPWLRDQLILKNKSLYFISMGVNFLLRCAWMQSLTHFHFGNSRDQYLTDFFFASLEVLRRGHWNFYRLENEHLNNVGKYRAVKTVPLPFRDDFVTSI